MENLTKHQRYRLNHLDEIRESDKRRRPASSTYISNKRALANYPNNSIIRSDLIQRRSRLKKYGLTLEQYDEMLAKQGGVCAICKKPETRKGSEWLSIDHDHKCCPQTKGCCGKCVRGLLCHNCNRWLGILEGAWSEQAKTYISERTVARLVAQ